MSRLYRRVLALLAIVTSGTGWGQVEPAAPAYAEPAPSQAERVPKFEGAIGLVLAARPAFSGSSQRTVQPQLAGFVRYGRFTLTGAGGFTTRRHDVVERGLDAELVRRGALRVHLSLRYDPGRREGESDLLRGMGDIDPTLRARLGVRWHPTPHWSVSLATNTDLLGHGGGYGAEAGVSRSFAIDARQRIVAGASLAAAGRRHMQTWHGVSVAQSAASGYPVYAASAGLRETGASLTWRIEADSKWAGYAGLGASRLLGSAAHSPLTTRRSAVSASAGIARRF